MKTIKDVAKQAGVSITTVSRALNGYSDVNEGTRRKIQEIADELGYRPNAVARGLVMKKTRTIGFIVSQLARSTSSDNLLLHEQLCGINDMASELDYDLILFTTSSNKQMQKSYKDLYRERKVDGTIISGLRLDDPYLQEAIQSELPCVLVDIPCEGNYVGYVMSDNVQGAADAVRHLTNNGHRYIGFVNGHKDAAVSIERLNGYKLGLEQSGLAFDDSLVADGQFSEQGAFDAVTRLIGVHPEITAVFCSSDVMAMGVVSAIKAMGKKVPDDVSVIGFDNIMLSQYVIPPITTVHQDMYRLGNEAAKLLIQILESERTENNNVSEPLRTILPVQLLERESVRRLT